MNEFIEQLNNTQDNKLRRKFYQLMLNLDVVNFNQLENWKESLIFLLSEQRYRQNQGLEHIFLNLLTSDLNENEMDFILFPILKYIDDVNPNIFYSLTELLKINLSKQKLLSFKKDLALVNSKNALGLLEYFDANNFINDNQKN